MTIAVTITVTIAVTIAVIIAVTIAVTIARHDHRSQPETQTACHARAAIIGRRKHRLGCVCVMMRSQACEG